MHPPFSVQIVLVLRTFISLEREEHLGGTVLKNHVCIWDGIWERRFTFLGQFSLGYHVAIASIIGTMSTTRATLELG